MQAQMCTVPRFPVIAWAHFIQVVRRQTPPTTSYHSATYQRQIIAEQYQLCIRLYKSPFLFLLKYFQSFHLISHETLVFWTARSQKLDLKPGPLPLTPFTDDETDTQGVSRFVHPRPPDFAHISFPSSTQLPFALLQVVKKGTLNEPILQSGMEGGKKALLIPLTTFFSRNLRQKKFSASRNSLNQSHM